MTHKNKFIIAVIAPLALLLVAGLLFGDVRLGGTESGTSIISSDTFVDDAGSLIKLDKPCGRIISLFPEHTENLFFLGAGESLIGVDETACFPPRVSELSRYSLSREHDVAQIIAAKPDLVLLSPDIARKHTSAITKLESAGLRMVSLRPSGFDAFDEYIQKLGMLCGRPEQAKNALIAFHRRIADISAKAAEAGVKRTIFFEASERGYQTAAAGSLPFLAIQYAGGVNIAGSPAPLNPGDTGAPFGLDKILAKADDIDIYVTLQGAGSSIVSIGQIPALGGVKAIREQRVYELNSLFIDSFTFRYATGVNEIARYLYPETFDDLSGFRTDRALDRRSFAKIVVRYFHLPYYVNAKASHYESERFNHMYGHFRDIDWQDEDFDDIETAVMMSYLPGERDENGEYFRPERLVTRSDVARFLYILRDIPAPESAAIGDIDGDANEAIIRKVVSAGLMEAENGLFDPNGTYTCNEFIEFLEREHEQHH